MNKKIIIAVAILLVVVGSYQAINYVADNKAKKQVNRELSRLQESGITTTYENIDIIPWKLDLVITDLKLSTQDNRVITIEKLTIDKIDLENEIPLNLTANVEGIIIDNLLDTESLGIEDNSKFNMALDYDGNIDGEFNLNKLNLNCTTLADIDLSFKLSNFFLSEDLVSNDFDSVGLNESSITYTDLGLMKTILSLFGSVYGVSSDEYSGMLSSMLQFQSSIISNQQMKEIFTLFSEFISHPNSITITSKPDRAIKFSEIIDSNDQMQLLEELNIKVSNNLDS